MYHDTFTVYHGTFTVYHGTFTVYHGTLKSTRVHFLMRTYTLPFLLLMHQENTSWLAGNSEADAYELISEVEDFYDDVLM